MPLLPTDPSRNPIFAGLERSLCAAESTAGPRSASRFWIGCDCDAFRWRGKHLPEARTDGMPLAGRTNAVSTPSFISEFLVQSIQFEPDDRAVAEYRLKAVSTVPGFSVARALFARVFLEHIPAAPKYNVATFVKDAAQKLEAGSRCAGDFAGWGAWQ